MAKIIHDEQIHLEPGLFSQGFVAGEFAFVAEDARLSHGALTDESTRDQARQTVENLVAARKTADMNLTDVVSLMVYLPDYSDAGLVCEVLDAAFGKDGETRPAATLVGIAGLDGNCRVRMDAIATATGDRQYFHLRELPLARGSRCHGVRVGNFVFLSVSTPLMVMGEFHRRLQSRRKQPKFSAESTISWADRIFRCAISAARSCLCRARIIGRAMAKRAEPFTRESFLRTSFRPTPEFIFAIWGKISCSAPSQLPIAARNRSSPAPR